MLAFVAPLWTIRLTLDDGNEWDLLPSIWMQNYSNTPGAWLRVQHSAEAECEGLSKDPIDLDNRVPDWMMRSYYSNCVENEIKRLEASERAEPATLRVKWDMIGSLP